MPHTSTQLKFSELRMPTSMNFWNYKTVLYYLLELLTTLPISEEEFQDQKLLEELQASMQVF